MSARHYHKSSSEPNIVVSLLKSVVSVLVLSAFVIGISYFVRGISQVDSDKLLAVSKPLLSRLNINIDNTQIGEVAGSMVARLKNANVSGGGSSVRTSTPANGEYLNTTSTPQVTPTPIVNVNKTALFSIGLLSDTHGNFTNLKKAEDVLKSKNINTFFFLGDLTELGLLEDLQSGKTALDYGGLTYTTLSGDHDLWKTVGYDNYLAVFKQLDTVKEINGVKFVLFDNSPNFTAVSDTRMAWFKTQVTDADFVVLSQPLFNTKLDMYMGRTNGEDVPLVLTQRDQLLELIRGSNVKAVIAGDLHMSGSVQDPIKPTLKHIYIGALTDERNLQAPKFSILKYFQDGSYDMQDVVLE